MKKGYTLTLTPEWDLTLDGAGNIAVSKGAYAIAQNGANAIRLFEREAYFDQKKGIPHFDIELGNKLNLSLSRLRSRVKRAALKVDGIIDVESKFKIAEERVLRGEVFFTLENRAVAKIEV